MMIIVGWRVIAAMNDFNETLTNINTGEFIPAKMIAHAYIALISWNRATLNHVLATERQEMNKYEQIMFKQKAIFLSYFKN